MTVVVAILATTLGACGGDDEVCSQPDGAGCYPVPDPAGEEPSETDEDFVLDTGLPVGEIEQLAELAADSSQNPEVVDVAEEIADAADALLDDLNGWEQEWDLEPTVYDSAVGTTQLSPYTYRGDEDYEVLQGLDGLEFDAYWVNVVLERVRAQIRAGQDLVRLGTHEALRTTIQDWVDTNEQWRDQLEVLEAELR